MILDIHRLEHHVCRYLIRATDIARHIVHLQEFPRDGPVLLLAQPLQCIMRPTHRHRRSFSSHLRKILWRFLAVKECCSFLQRPAPGFHDIRDNEYKLNDEPPAIHQVL